MDKIIPKGGIDLNVDTSFTARRKERQRQFERSLLRELSLDLLKRSVHQYFGIIYTGNGSFFDDAVEEGCCEIAVEAYLLGSRYSRLGYFGIPTEEIDRRSTAERISFAEALAEFIIYWCDSAEKGTNDEFLTRSCGEYVDYWWNEGFRKGTRKYKLKLR